MHKTETATHPRICHTHFSEQKKRLFCSASTIPDQLWSTIKLHYRRHTSQSPVGCRQSGEATMSALCGRPSPSAPLSSLAASITHFKQMIRFSFLYGAPRSHLVLCVSLRMILLHSFFAQWWQHNSLPQSKLRDIIWGRPRHGFWQPRHYWSRPIEDQPGPHITFNRLSNHLLLLHVRTLTWQSLSLLVFRLFLAVHTTVRTFIPILCRKACIYLVYWLSSSEALYIQLFFLWRGLNQTKECSLLTTTSPIDTITSVWTVSAS